jgi:hypothetical protein
MVLLSEPIRPRPLYGRCRTTRKDFAMVGTVASYPLGDIGAADSPVKSFSDLLAAPRRPRRLTYSMGSTEPAAPPGEWISIGREPPWCTPFKGSGPR